MKSALMLSLSKHEGIGTLDQPALFDRGLDE